MNQIILIGNLTKDPELAQTQSGVSVCKFTVAVQRNFKSANGENEADFIPVVAWRMLAENCGKYLAKGRKVAVVGELRIRTYEASDGSKRYVSEVLANEIEFLTPKQNCEIAQSATPSNKVQQSSFEDLQPINDGDLPF